VDLHLRQARVPRVGAQPGPLLPQPLLFEHLEPFMPLDFNELGFRVWGLGFRV